MIGDLLPNFLENLAVLTEDVIVPLLNNPANQNGWTSVIVNDTKTESQNVLNGIAQMRGLVMNRTILPLPICIEEVMASAPDIAKGYNMYKIHKGSCFVNIFAASFLSID